MRIRQVITPADCSHAIVSILPELEQLGLKINYDLSVSLQETGCLFICDLGFESTQSGSATIRYALSKNCCVLMDPEKFYPVLDELRNTGEISNKTNQSLAAHAIYKCIEADARILNSLQDGLPYYAVCAYERAQELRYGENWHQRAALYVKSGGLGLHNAKKLNGKEMSYNNIVDAETVLEMLIDLSEYDGVRLNKPLSIIAKHANPCGVAYGMTLEQSYRLSFATDPKSAFGGVIGFNQPLDLETAQAVGNSFVEVLLAPGFEPDALKTLTKNKPNRRIFDVGNILERKDELFSGYYAKSIFGGMMLQDYDIGDIEEWKVVTCRVPTESENKALRFAWKVTKYVKSNALVYATENRTIGIGSGQVSRVDAARFGAEKATEHGMSTIGTVAATDSFFPFRDGLDEIYKAGATAAVHPGGSIRDAEVIEAANEYEMAMVFTGMRHFRH
jgi:phosphoribosylaminoimidazolecarboxamide formyltransferase/IMP cyclohydrolase